MLPIHMEYEGEAVHYAQIYGLYVCCTLKVACKLLRWSNIIIIHMIYTV